MSCETGSDSKHKAYIKVIFLLFCFQEQNIKRPYKCALCYHSEKKRDYITCYWGDGLVTG